MKLFEKINNLKREAPTQKETTIEVNKVKYDINELERRARLNKPLTQDEHTALEKYRKQETSNRILRIVGIIGVLVLVALAVGCFLYPYSLLNIFGNNDKFWDCWNHVQYHLGPEVMQKYYEACRSSFETVDYLPPEKFYECEIFCRMHDISNATAESWGWMTLNDIMTIAFQPGTGFKCCFIVVGSWSIVVLSTVGLIALVVYAIYAVSYNIKDLINLVKHLIRGTKYVVGDVADTIREQTEEVFSDIGKNKKTTKTVKQKKVKEYKAIIEDPVDEDEAEIQRKLSEYKQEIAEEEEALTKPKTEPIGQDINNMSDAELDRLLSNK